MKKFIKAIAYSFVILTAIELGLTFYVSRLNEQKFKEIENLLNDNQLISSETILYKRGLFTSEAISNIRFKNLELKNPIQIKHTIFNGPVIFNNSKERSIEFKLALIKSVPNEMTSEAQLPFVTNTIVYYNGKIENVTEGSLYKIQNPRVQISGPTWSSKSIITNNGTGFKGKILIPETVVQFMGMIIPMKGIEINFDQTRSSFGNWIGNVSFLLNNAVQKEQNFEINNLKLEEDSLLKDQLIDVTWKFEFSKAAISNSTYGPAFVKIQAFNLDPEGLRGLSENKVNMSEDHSKNILKKILVRRPIIKIENAQFTLPQGNVHLDAELSAGGPDITIPLNKDMVEKTLEGNFLLVLPKEAFKQGLLAMLKFQLAKDPEYQKMNDAQKAQNLDQKLNLKIDQLKQNQILFETEKNYEIKISIDKGKWVVNGKIVPQPLS